ncbi:hypothetical protein G6L37_06400 [Agrobacterium rubi]|nr:hypothetical protein [Agrobacterium rubi]NTF24993.1 hypothetical protein [Agrobacterium rubi]
MGSCGKCVRGQMESFTGALVDCCECGGSGISHLTGQAEDEKDLLIRQLQQKIANLQASYGELSAMIEEKNVTISRLNGILNERLSS